MPGLTHATFLFQHPSRHLARRPLRVFFEETVAQFADGVSVTCLITDDARVRALNRQFRGKDSATDVLSFPSEEGGGEIAISLDTAARQAAEMGHAVEQELRILMLHGLLHLAGMDHATDSGRMARAETKWRKRLGLATGLIERTRKRPHR
jgi:probable rRNA maturation factor